MTMRITLKSDKLAKVHELIAVGQKIKAIKIVRDSGKIFSSDASKPGEKPDLREAKLAIDQITGKASTKYTLAPEWHVHSLTVSGPGGERIEVDLENLQLHFLTTLASVGLDEMARLLGLVDFIKQWQGDVPLSAELVPAEEETN